MKSLQSESNFAFAFAVSGLKTSILYSFSEKRMFIDEMIIAIEGCDVVVQASEDAYHSRAIFKAQRHLPFVIEYILHL